LKPFDRDPLRDSPFPQVQRISSGSPRLSWSIWWGCWWRGWSGWSGICVLSRRSWESS